MLEHLRVGRTGKIFVPFFVPKKNENQDMWNENQMRTKKNKICTKSYLKKKVSFQTHLTTHLFKILVPFFVPNENGNQLTIW